MTDQTTEVPVAKRALTLEQKQKASAYLRDWYQRNKDYARARGQTWRDANRERVRELTRAQTRRWTLKHKYGLTFQDYEAMLAAQGNSCALCGVDKPGAKKDWRVDHCHTTGRVRGILCHNCNVALGHVKEDTDVLRKMITYLESNR